MTRPENGVRDSCPGRSLRGRERIALGKEGEAKAERYLKELGYRLLERSCRTRIGEIDLIMQDGDTLVFVEVRSRSNSNFGLPEESVGRHKQEKVGKVAAVYLQSRRLGQIPIRFDVVAVTGDALRHIPNAFSVSGYTF